MRKLIRRSYALAILPLLPAAWVVDIFCSKAMTGEAVTPKQSIKDITRVWLSYWR